MAELINYMCRVAYLTLAMFQKSTTQVSKMAYFFVSQSQNGPTYSHPMISMLCI